MVFGHGLLQSQIVSGCYPGCAAGKRRLRPEDSRHDPVPDDVWEEAARHYDERQLGALVLTIAGINAWNRINAATRQITGEWVSQFIRGGRATVQAA